MDLTPKQQASEAIRQAEAILIVTGQRPNIDQVSSVVALASILRKVGKRVTALVSDQVPNSANFITQGNIERQLTGLRDFVLKVDLSKAEVDKLKYDIEGGKLNIHIMPFKGGFTPGDVSFSHGDYHYDLIISMGVPQRAKLDRVFEQNPGLLASTPLLNIDYHRINESYGAINLVDTNAATLSEMLISLAESLETGLIDEPIATAMLTGIIASTDRFTASHTTAKAMTVAAQLMAAGAKQQNIVKALYGSRDNKEREGRDGRDRRERQPEHRKPEQPMRPVSPAAQKVVQAPAAQSAPAPQPEATATIEPLLAHTNGHADVVTNHDAAFDAPTLPTQPQPSLASVPNGQDAPPFIPPVDPMANGASNLDQPNVDQTSSPDLSFRPYEV